MNKMTFSFSDGLFNAALKAGNILKSLVSLFTLSSTTNFSCTKRFSKPGLLSLTGKNNSPLENNL